MDLAGILLQAPIFGDLTRGDVEKIVLHLLEQRLLPYRVWHAQEAPGTSRGDATQRRASRQSGSGLFEHEVAALLRSGAGTRSERARRYLTSG